MGRAAPGLPTKPRCITQACSTLVHTTGVQSESAVKPVCSPRSPGGEVWAAAGASRRSAGERWKGSQGLGVTRAEGSWVDGSGHLGERSQHPKKPRSQWLAESSRFYRTNTDRKPGLAFGSSRTRDVRVLPSGIRKLGCKTCQMLLLTWALKCVLTYFAMVSGNTGDSVLFEEKAQARRRARSGLAARAPDGSLLGPPRPLPSPQCPLGDACGWNRLSRVQASSALHCPGPQLAEKMLKNGKTPKK